MTTINEKFITISDTEIMDKVKNNFIPYIRWKENIISKFDVREIEIRDVFMFGSRVGFVTVNAVAFNIDTGKQVPSYAFLRGDSVSIMPVLHCDGETYTVFVTESRTPIGKVNQTSLPAGMIDKDSFMSAALRELEEEVGPEFNITQNDMIDLGSYPVSAGGTDEFIKMYAFEKEISKETINAINGRVTGAENENEHIIVSIKPLETLKTDPSVDMRSALSYYLWMNRS